MKKMQYFMEKIKTMDKLTTSWIRWSIEQRYKILNNNFQTLRTVRELSHGQKQKKNKKSKNKYNKDWKVDKKWKKKVEKKKSCKNPKFFKKLTCSFISFTHRHSVQAVLQNVVCQCLICPSMMQRRRQIHLTIQND